MDSPIQFARSVVKNFKIKNEAINPKTGVVDAAKVATFTEKLSRGSKRGYVKNGHQLSTHAHSWNAGLRNYLKTREDKKNGQVGNVGLLRTEQIAFIDTVKSVAIAGQALNDAHVEASAKFILNGDWEKDSYRITPDLAANVRYIASRLDEANLDARAMNRQPPAPPMVNFG